MRFEFVAVGGRAKGKRSAGLEGRGEKLRAESPSGIVKGIPRGELEAKGKGRERWGMCPS